MDDVLELSQCPYAPKYPVGTMDEKPLQLIKETRTPLSAKPGKPQRYDDDYERGGTANVFLFTEPWRGWRMGEVREQRPSVEGAHQLKSLLHEPDPTAEKVRVVCDNLNTHKRASL
jgi:DDE superfamily endonuclease